jgi:hypothetical protein
MFINNKNNHCYRFLLFIGILFSIIQIISYIPKQRSNRKNGNFWPFFYEELPKNSTDIVFMGSSHSKTTFIPQIVDDILRTESIHVNTSGESIYQTIYEYQEVLLHQNPKVVIIESSPIYSGLDQKNLKLWNFSFFYSMPTSLRKLIYSHNFFSDGDLLKFYLPYTSNHSDWKNPDILISRVKTEFETIKNNWGSDQSVELPHKGYENYLKSLLPGQIQSKKPSEIGSCPTSDFEDRLSVTEDILQISQKHSEGLMFIEAPQYINEYENCRDQAIDLIESYDVSYETLFNDHGRSPLWFGDYQHMTQFGAIIASVETAELLAQNFNFDISPENLDYYRSYFFSDYTFTQEGNSINIILIPENNEALKNLDFKWEVFLDGKSIYKIEETGKNELKATLPEPVGTYFFHIMINNPDSDYYLRKTWILNGRFF